MQASELIKKMQELIDQHGDLRVAWYDGDRMDYSYPSDVMLEVCKKSIYYDCDLEEGESFFEIKD